MSPKPDDDHDPHSLTLDEALARIAAEVTPLTGFEQLALRSALDRVLCADVLSPLDVPGHANSGMDGYAIRVADLPAAGEREFTVVGTAFAGHPFAGAVGEGEAVRIMTGAVVPAGSDTVVKQEETVARGERVVINAGHKRGANVRLPGEDIRQGATVLARGRRLIPADLGLLASLGIAEVKVFRRPRVAFFSTGDELRSVGETLANGQIYDSNRYTLFGMLTRLGAEVLDMGVVPDDRAATRRAFEEAAAQADMLITSGGVSVGEADYVKETLQALGRVNFWKIAMKPGKPLAFGHLGQTLFFGLPGNPVSVMATFYQVVQPNLRRLSGESATERLRLRVPCADALKKAPGRLDFQRGVLARDTAGNLVVSSAGMQGSHVLSGMSRANCFIVLPPESGNVAAGTLVEVEPFAGLV
jgi:molybdopterin molybdotransferase